MNAKELFSILAPALIGGIFTILGVWYTHRLQVQAQHAPQQPQSYPPSPSSYQAPTQISSYHAMSAPPSYPKTNTQTLPATVNGIRIGAVLRDVGIVMLLTFIGGLLIGMTMGEDAYYDPDGFLMTLAIVNIVFGSIGFAISGYFAKPNRWSHLFIVALGVWFASLINLLFGVTMAGWISSIVGVLIMMGIGGGISMMLRRN